MKRRRWVVAGLLALLALVGWWALCFPHRFTVRDGERVRLRMTEAEVLQILGEQPFEWWDEHTFEGAVFDMGDGTILAPPTGIPTRFMKWMSDSAQVMVLFLDDRAIWTHVTPTGPPLWRLWARRVGLKY